MKTTFCLIRHGETNWNRLGIMQGQKDIPLNEKGILQASLCGEFLKKEQWDIIVSSPLKRAKKTAEIIGASVGINKISEIEKLQERFYERNTIGIETSFDEPNQLDTNETETIQVLTDRSMEGLTLIADKHPGKKIIVVSHGDVIQAILSAIAPEEISYNKIKLENACLNLLSHNSDTNKWAIISYNVVSHLEK